jgi:uncharacterized protein
MLLHEAIDASVTARICQDGSLVAEVPCARVGIQTYLRAETSAPDTFTGDQVRVYRPEEEVFARDSLASYAAAPVTVNHPDKMVVAANWRQLGVGEINGDIARDGEKVRVPLIVRDAAAVRKAQTTHKQLSMGYTCTLDWTPGTTPQGEAYDAVQRDIRINHIALVPVARGGPELRIVDERPKEPAPMKIKIGDAEVDATNGEAVRIAVDALNTKLTAANTQIGTLTADLATANTAVQTKDGEIAALNAKLADAAVTPEKLQALADARADVIAKAKTLSPQMATDGKTDMQIRKEAVQAKLGDAAKDMADAAIEGAFLALTKDAKPNVQSLGSPIIATDAATEYQNERNKQRRAIADAWRKPFSAADAAAAAA